MIRLAHLPTGKQQLFSKKPHQGYFVSFSQQICTEPALTVCAPIKIANQPPYQNAGLLTTTAPNPLGMNQKNNMHFKA